MPQRGDTVKAWIFRRYGGPEVLEWAELPEPVPGRGEIVVRVVAAALNPLDWKLRAGQFKVMTLGRLPRGVGYDYA
ncbi:MAG: NADP-dependent oxidoreductase, partial [Vicinamibacterales bacterium]